MATTNKVNLDVAQRLDITARRGDTFKLSLTFKNSNSTPKQVQAANYLFYMQVREGAFDDEINTAILSTDMDPTASVTTFGTGANVVNNTTGAITVDQSDGSNGNVSFTADRRAMANILSGTYFYDIQAETVPSEGDQPVVTTWLTGRITFNEDVTVSSSTSV